MTRTAEKKVSTTNTVFMVVEPTFTDNEFSVVIYDEHNLFIEKLVKGFEAAVKKAEKLFATYTNN